MFAFRTSVGVVDLFLKKLRNYSQPSFFRVSAFAILIICRTHESDVQMVTVTANMANNCPLPAIRMLEQGVQRVLIPALFRQSILVEPPLDLAINKEVLDGACPKQRFDERPGLGKVEVFLVQSLEVLELLVALDVPADVGVAAGPM